MKLLKAGHDWFSCKPLKLFFLLPFSGLATGSEYKSRASHQLPGAHESPARSGRRDAK